MTVSDEMLMAYLDNELPPAERAVVDAALRDDADVRARLKRQERVHQMLSAAFDPSVGQAVPERLVAAAMTTPVSWRWRLAGLFGFGGEARPGFVPRFASAMAVLVVGVALGLFISRGLMATHGFGDGPLVAEGDLARVLETQLANDEVAAGPRVGVSFRAKDGLVCRSFDMGQRENFAGVACRAPVGWVINTLVRAEPRTGAPYETAGAGMPSAVRDAVAAMIGGDAFDAAAEQRARDDGWR
jgi:hypothetical protein